MAWLRERQDLHWILFMLTMTGCESRLWLARFLLLVLLKIKYSKELLKSGIESKPSFELQMVQCVTTSIM